MNKEILIQHLEKFKWLTNKDAGMACCVFHNESNPSMGVSFSKRVYNCFGCGASGSIKELYEHFNLPYAKRTILSSFDSKEKITKKDLDNAFKIIQNKKKILLDLENKDLLEEHNYLDFRDITQDIKDTYYIRYDIKEEALYAPIFNNKNEVIAAYRRYRNPKYGIKCKYTEGFRMSHSLYGLNNFKGQEIVLITEGINDALTCYTNLQELNLFDSIIPLSCYSSNNFTINHINILKKYRIKHCILLFDNDEAGKKGINNILTLINNKKHNKKNNYVKFYIPDFNLYPEDAKDPDLLFSNQLQILLESIKPIEYLL